MKDNHNTIAYAIEEIARKRIPAWDIAFLLNNDPFVVAGGCFGDNEPNDYDIYPAPSIEKFNFSSIRSNVKSLDNSEVICESRNALTVKVKDKILQFCNYSKKTLEELIKSFDFSHCQVGVVYLTTETDTGGFGTPYVGECYYTDEWIEYRINRKVVYTGSEYPLSSLIRLFKYVKRGLLPGRSYIYPALRILEDVISRGYKDYEDYKNQLDAIDLQLLNDEENRSGDVAYRLYDILCRRNLVDNPRSREDEEDG